LVSVSKAFHSSFIISNFLLSLWLSLSFLSLSLTISLSLSYTLSSHDLLLFHFIVIGGEQLSKQHSAHSLIPKPSLSDYNQILRSNSSREASYLEVRDSHGRVWERKWVVFEQGHLRISPNPLSSQNDIKLLPMENVELLRSNVSLNANRAC
jgi:uncharacterized membrane protein